MWRNYQKSDVLKIAKSMFKTNQNIIKNGDGVLGVRDEGTKSYYDKLLNTNFVWDRNSLSQVDIVDVTNLIDKGVVRDSLSNIKMVRLQDHQLLCQKRQRQHENQEQL